MSSSSTILSQPEELDKINQLPEDILIKVISALELKNARQTSLLAKRWRYLWTWRSDLDLDLTKMSPNNRGWIFQRIGWQGYLNWVNEIIDAHRGPRLTKFCVSFHTERSNDVSQVEKWARFALSKRVEELVLQLHAYPKSCRFSLGFDILKHPLYYNGIVNLRSLHLSSVHLTGETLEFILLHSHLLERLYVGNSMTLHTLNIVSSTLKHLTLNTCSNLNELKIDAVNLISLHYEDNYGEDCAHIVFKKVPKLVEVGFAGNICLYPFPILDQFSDLSKQLTKLSLRPQPDPFKHVSKGFHGGVQIGALFPNVKDLICNFFSFSWMTTKFVKCFTDACPMLQALKIQVDPLSASLKEEAKQLQEIEIENEREDKLSKDQNSDVDTHPKRQEYHNNRNLPNIKNNNCSHPNLKVLEIVGFRGWVADVDLALDIIDYYATSFETLICDPRRCRSIGRSGEHIYDDEMADIRRQSSKSQGAENDWFKSDLIQSVGIAIAQKSELLNITHLKETEKEKKDKQIRNIEERFKVNFHEFEKLDQQAKMEYYSDFKFGRGLEAMNNGEDPGLVNQTIAELEKCMESSCTYRISKEDHIYAVCALQASKVWKGDFISFANDLHADVKDRLEEMVCLYYDEFLKVAPPPEMPPQTNDDSIIVTAIHEGVERLFQPLQKLLQGLLNVLDKQDFSMFMLQIALERVRGNKRLVVMHSTRED